MLAELLGQKGGKLPDVVQLSGKMGGLDGLAVARTIPDGLPQGKCTLLIMSPTLSPTSLASQSGVELVDALLEKPVTESNLHNAMLEARRKRTATNGVSFCPASVVRPKPVGHANPGGE